jgi:hypothetical protein
LPTFQPGNHDAATTQWKSPAAKRAPTWNAWMQNHAKIGWTLLNDTSHTIERGGDKIAVLGVQNWSSHANFPKHGNSVAGPSPPAATRCSKSCSRTLLALGGTGAQLS